MRRELFHHLGEAPLLWLGIVLCAAAIFVADTVTDREIAFAVLHVAVVLLAVRSGRARAVLAVGIGCAGLTLLSYLLTPKGDPESGVVNCALSLLAIGATTYLALRSEATAARARQAQSELARMSRVMVIGELGASIAHEVSQPVTAIAANGSAALRWLSAVPPDHGEVRQALDRIVGDAGRAGEVIGRVRRLVARTAPARDRIDIAEVITEALMLARAEIRRNEILLRTELATDLPVISGDRVQIQQVILNFVINAIESLTEVEGERTLLVSAATTPQGTMVSMRDTGAGIPPAALDRIFEAFYTTKPSGTGMGLAISKSIVEAHGGTVHAAHNYPRGAVFGFTLPASPAAKG